MDDLDWLMHWFLCHCDGDWEHMYGIEIKTIENSGWFFEVSIQETELQDKYYSNFKINRKDDGWIQAQVDEGYFTASFGVHNLSEAIYSFKKWATSVEEMLPSPYLNWLAESYQGIHQESLGSSFSVQIYTLDNPGWAVKFFFKDGILKKNIFFPLVIERSENDWIHCKFEENSFEFFCGPLNLKESLQILKQFIDS